MELLRCLCIRGCHSRLRNEISISAHTSGSCGHGVNRALQLLETLWSGVDSAIRRIAELSSIHRLNGLP